VLIDHPRGLATLSDDRAKLVVESGRLERALSVVLVDIDLTALRARLG
jgi:hypothetical protein